MSAFFRSALELASCDTLDELLDAVVALCARSFGGTACIELWDSHGNQFTRGQRSDHARPTWIGTRYTLGALYVESPLAPQERVELLAVQLAPIAELLIEREESRRRTLREDIAHVYDRRIRDELVRFDWNASAVARQLSVGRGRVAKVTRRWRPRRHLRPLRS